MKDGMNSDADALIDMAAAFSLVVARDAGEDGARLARMDEIAKRLDAPGGPVALAGLISAVQRAAVTFPPQWTPGAFNAHAGARRDMAREAEVLLRQRASQRLERAQ